MFFYLVLHIHKNTLFNIHWKVYHLNIEFREDLMYSYSELVWVYSYIYVLYIYSSISYCTYTYILTNKKLVFKYVNAYFKYRLRIQIHY